MKRQSSRGRLIPLFLIPIALALALKGCGGDDWYVSNYKASVGGEISGLSGTVVLQNNGNDSVSAKTDGAFAFPTKLPYGSSYNVTVLTQPIGQGCTVTNGKGTVTAAVTNVGVVCTSGSYSVGGTVTGLLAGGSVTLQNNGGDNLAVSTNGAFTFPAKVPHGDTYEVTVLVQPKDQTCSVSTGVGTISGKNVTNVTVVCSKNTYSVGGTVSGLTGSVVLQNNNGDNLTVAANGAFTFVTRLASGSPFSVTVLAHPAGQRCSVASGTGTIAAANITTVAVTCTSAYTIGGTVTGLTGSVVLQNNNGDNLTVAANGVFTFATALASGSPYSVTVLTHPAGQTCSVASGTGTIAAANVTNALVTCSNSNIYSVGGTVSGLTGSVVLQNNNGDNLTVTANGAFTFAALLANGSPYSVTVLTQPAGQTCTVASGTGTIAAANVTSVAITCTSNTYSVGGTISGLTGSVVLQNNNGDNLTVAASGAFTFATALADGSPYNVTVLTQPAGQTCTVANGTGTVAAANVTSVSISCI